MVRVKMYPVNNLSNRSHNYFFNFLIIVIYLIYDNRFYFPGLNGISLKSSEFYDQQLR